MEIPKGIEMFCEICGERKAVETIGMEGMELRVCPACTRFGTPVAEQKAPVRKDPVEFHEPDILPDYAERIRDALRKRGLSVRVLAEKLSERASTLEKVEKGKMLPDRKLAKKLEKFLGIVITGSVEAPGRLHRGLPEATLGDIAEVRVKK